LSPNNPDSWPIWRFLIASSQGKRDIKSTGFVFVFHSILRVGQFLGIQLGSNPQLLLRSYSVVKLLGIQAFACYSMRINMGQIS
jgi:hypothetical protein